MSGPGDSGISVTYIREEMKLPEIQVALQRREREVGLAEAALQASYAGEVYSLTTFWSWRVSMMHDALRLLREEHELHANMVRKMDDRVACSRIRESERREREERDRRRVKMFCLSSNCAVPGKPNMSRSW